MKIGIIIIPFVVSFVVLYGYLKGVDVFDTFCEGAKEGLSIVYRITPPLIGILVGIAMITTSGALDVLLSLFSPITNLLRIPSEVTPLLFLRPISGSGSLAIVSNIFKTYGVDSFIGKCASVMMGSTETTFYTIALYFGSIAIKKGRHTIGASLIADLCSFLASLFFVTLFLK